MRSQLVWAMVISGAIAAIALTKPWAATDSKATAVQVQGASVAGINNAHRDSAVSALGRLEPASRVIKVAAPSGNEGNRLESLRVKEGDDVVQGEVLAYMDTHSRRLAAQNQEQARLATAMAKLNQVKEGSKPGDIEAARAMVESAERDLATKQRERARAEQLKRNNAISDAEVDQYRLAHEQATAMLRQSQAQLNAVSEVRAVDVALAESEVRLAEAAVELAKANVAATQVIAPCDGRILRIHARPGEQVPGEGLLELGHVDQMQAVAEVFEGDIPMLRHGDEAVVTIDTTGHTLPGRVQEIGHVVARKAILTNDPVSDTDARVVEVRIDIEHSRFEWLARLSNARVKVRIGASMLPAHNEPAVSRAATGSKSAQASSLDDTAP